MKRSFENKGEIKTFQIKEKQKYLPAKLPVIQAVVKACREREGKLC